MGEGGSCFRCTRFTHGRGGLAVMFTGELACLLTSRPEASGAFRSSAELDEALHREAKHIIDIFEGWGFGFRFFFLDSHNYRIVF